MNRGWQEFGSVTGRLRRAAPFNFKLAKRSVRLEFCNPDCGHKIGLRFSQKQTQGDPSRICRESNANLSKKSKAELATPVVYIGTGQMLRT